MKRWRFTFWGAVLGFLVALVALLFAGGGHGWGTDLYWYGLRPVVRVVLFVDSIWWRYEEVRSNLREGVLLSIMFIGGILQFALVGLLTDLIRRRVHHR